MASLGVVYDEAMMQHESALPHPEQPARILSIFQALTDGGIVEKCARTCCMQCAH